MLGHCIVEVFRSEGKGIDSERIIAQFQQVNLEFSSYTVGINGGKEYGHWSITMLLYELASTVNLYFAWLIFALTPTVNT